MTIKHTDCTSDVVPSVCLNADLNPSIDQCAIASEPNGYVLSNKNEIQPVQPVGADDLMENQSTYIVENSNDVVIGPVTHFHCPVTIIQKRHETNSKESIASTQSGTEERCKHDEAHKINIKQQHDVPNKLSGNQPTRESRSSLKYLVMIKQLKTRWKTLNVVLIGITLISFALAVAIGVVVTTQVAETVIVREGPKPNETVPNDDYNPNGTEPIMVPRLIWGARPPLSVRPLKLPVKYVLVAHTGTARSCYNLEDCSGMLQTLQSYAVEHNSPDIGYNFLIGSDGNIYVGRGWGAINYLQNHTISVAFVGNFSYDEFTEKMQAALKKLINIGLHLKILKADYVLLSHSQTGSTLSPGPNIRNVIKTWPHYYKNEYIDIAQ